MHHNGGCKRMNKDSAKCARNVKIEHGVKERVRVRVSTSHSTFACCALTHMAR